MWLAATILNITDVEHFVITENSIGEQFLEAESRNISMTPKGEKQK